MAGSSQPQHVFAAECVFADFAIAVIFYPLIKTKHGKSFNPSADMFC